jgi:hypothetical protein
VITLHDFGGAMGRLLDLFFEALTVSWSQLLARVRSGPKQQDGGHFPKKEFVIFLKIR